MDNYNNNNKCIWLFEVLIFIFIVLSFALLSLTTYYNINSDYLPRQYEKNWNMNYIIDVIPTVEEKCPDGYETKILGKWSGLGGGCYCYNNKTYTRLATDENCNEILNDIFICEPLPKHDPIDIIRYKNFQFCIKRSNDNYIKLFEKVKEIYIDENRNDFNGISNDNPQKINTISYKYYDKYTDYINTLLHSSLPNYIDENGILELIIIDTSYKDQEIKKKKFLSYGYEEKKITDHLSMFIYRIRNFRGIGGLVDIHLLQNILVDIHIYNELLCAYLDLSSTYLKSKFSIDEVDYADIKYCEDFYLEKNSTLTINDDTNHFPIDDSYKDYYDDNNVGGNRIYDFYRNTGIPELYKSFTKDDEIKINLHGNFKPILSAQFYYFGMGCIYSKHPLDHIKVLRSNTILGRLSAGIAVMQFVNIILIFIYFGATFRNCLQIKKNIIFIQFIQSVISFLISLYIDITSKMIIDYLKEYMIYCQTNYLDTFTNNALMTTKLEKKFFETMMLINRSSSAATLFLFLSCFFLFMYLYSSCFKNDKVKNINEVESFNNKNPKKFSSNQEKDIEINVVERDNNFSNKIPYRQQPVMDVSCKNDAIDYNKKSNPESVTSRNDLLSGVGFPEAGNSKNDFGSSVNEKYINKEAPDGKKDICGISDRSNINNNFDK